MRKLLFALPLLIAAPLIAAQSGQKSHGKGHAMPMKMDIGNWQAPSPASNDPRPLAIEARGLVKP